LSAPSRDRFDLSELRADGWFEQLGEEIPEFEQLCQIVGRRFVAFSFVASVRISSIAYDPHAPHSSLIDFSFGEDGEPLRLALSEFRERLGAVLAAEEEEPEALSAAPGLDAVRRHIGRRYVLLAPIFGIRLLHLEHGGGAEPSLTLELGNSREELSVDGFRNILHNAIRAEVARSRPSAPFSIDFKKVGLAEAANQRGDFDETIAQLGAWPGPLSMFLRTAQGQALGTNERAKLVRALGVLGEAYIEKGQLDWAEDVLRLGIQFGQELANSGVLFGLLGHSRVAAGRHGEAIGLLRRALGLGGEPREVLPDLARCFAARGRNVAAMACLDQARAAGAKSPELDALEQQIAAALGPAHGRFRALVASRTPG
jgi:tetratricopeptide (TPR) repeat protein